MVAKDGTQRCVSYEDCLKQGVYTTQFDGMRLCSARCPTGYVNVSVECRESYPDWCKTDEN